MVNRAALVDRDSLVRRGQEDRGESQALLDLPDRREPWDSWAQPEHPGNQVRSVGQEPLD